eukprot:4248976-Prorocentrum_lima.AAC.1
MTGSEGFPTSRLSTSLMTCLGRADELIPILTLTLDQCAVSYSACWYLMCHEHLNVALLPDASHGNHNDLHGAI